MGKYCLLSNRILEMLWEMNRNLAVHPALSLNPTAWKYSYPWLKIENVLSWRNIYSSNQFATDIKEKIANQEEALRGGISRIYFTFPNIWKSCHGAINSWPLKLRTTLENLFWFNWNYNQVWLEARNNMSNCEIYFPLFSEINTVLKTF